MNSLIDKINNHNNSELHGCCLVYLITTSNLKFRFKSNKILSCSPEVLLAAMLCPVHCDYKIWELTLAVKVVSVLLCDAQTNHQPKTPNGKHLNTELPWPLLQKLHGKQTHKPNNKQIQWREEKFWKVFFRTKNPGLCRCRWSDCNQATLILPFESNVSYILVFFHLSCWEKQGHINARFVIQNNLSLE